MSEIYIIQAVCVGAIKHTLAMAEKFALITKIKTTFQIPGTPQAISLTSSLYWSSTTATSETVVVVVVL